MSNLCLSVDRVLLNELSSVHLNNNIISLIQCKICKGVLTDPYDCQCCNENFCYTCINNFFIKNKKCPNEKCENVDNFTVNKSNSPNNIFFPNIKPSNINLVTFINSLKFSCVNKTIGCVEEIDFNNIIQHQQICQYNSDNITETNHPNESFHRKLSVMSFNVKNENLNDLQASESVFPNVYLDKIDKILEFMQYLSSTVGTKNLTNTPPKELRCETPNFNLSLCGGQGSSNLLNSFVYNPNTNLNYKLSPSRNFLIDNESSNNINNNNLTIQEKIISEIELINDKISSVETLIENCISQNENSIKKFIEEQLSLFFDKLMDCSSTNSISTPSNSTFSVKIQKPKPKIVEKYKTKILQTKEKEKISPTILKKNFNSFANCNSTSPKVKPKLNQSESVKLTESVKLIVNNYQQQSNYNTESLSNKNNISEFSLCSPSDIMEKLNNIEKTLSNKINEINNNLNNILVEEIKSNFLDVTLDSSNLFVQKFDEFIKVLNQRPIK